MERRKNAWHWIPSFYFIEGIMFMITMSISTMLLKRLNLPYADITCFTSWLYLPWVLLPLWKPYVKTFSSLKGWICGTQFLIAVALLGVAIFVKMPESITGIMLSFGIIAIGSAFLEVISDEYYAQQLSPEEQKRFISPRSKIYHAATIVGFGLTLMIAGGTEVYFRQVPKAWYMIFLVIASVMFLLAIYHLLILPRHKGSLPIVSTHPLNNIRTFLQKKDILFTLAFILLFNLPKALLAKISLIFLIDPISKGGLALSLTQIGFAQGTIGIIGLSFGGFIGNNLIARDGLRKWLWLMAFSITLPNFLYIYLASMSITHFGIICSCIFIEQFGYGFGLTMFLYCMMHFTQGQKENEHFCICSSLVSLSLMIPGIISGQMLSEMGYSTFFWCAACLGALTLGLTYLLRHKID